MNAHVRRIAGYTAAAAFTALLLVLIARRIDLRAALGLWVNVRPLPVAGAVAVMFLEAFILESFKWHLLLRWKGIRIPYRDALRIKVSAAIFHVGLPLKLGAVTESVYLHRASGCRLDHALSTITLDILVNFMAMLLLATLSTVVMSLGAGGLLGFPVWFWSLAGACAFLVLLVPFFPLGRRALEVAAGVLPGGAGEFACGLLEGFRDLGVLRVGTLMAIAVLMQLLAVGMWCLVFLAFDARVPFVSIAVVAPTVFFLGSIPVTVSGFGTREWMVLYFLTERREMMTPEQAVEAALFFGVAVAAFQAALSLPFLPQYMRMIAFGSGEGKGRPPSRGCSLQSSASRA